VKIPKVLHRIWVGGPMPAELVMYGATWQRHHPDWTHLLWTDQPQGKEHGVTQLGLPHLFNEELYREAERYAPGFVGQFRADILRYELMYQQGGVYVDADFECRKSISDLVHSDAAFAAWETDGVWINNAILGSVAGHDFFGALIEGLQANVTLHHGRRPNSMTGPQYFTSVYRSRSRLGLEVPTIYSSRLFYPYLWSELRRQHEKFPKAYAVHHWHNRRRSVTA
jgi:inositol phosphorylceramide mannosyltransferase catalytic subunit